MRGLHGARRTGRREVAFGPVLAVERSTYDAAGGHGHERVRASLTEDIELARQVGRSRLFSARRDATFRMYPQGLGQSVAGWSRTLAAGISSTRWWLGLLVVAWVWSLAGGPFTGWVAYPLSAVQVWVLGRRAGRVGAVLAALYPVLVLALAVIVVRGRVVACAGHDELEGSTGQLALISRRILPTLASASMWRWASAISSSGKRRSMTGCSAPGVNSGSTSSANRRQIDAFSSSGGRAAWCRSNGPA